MKIFNPAKPLLTQLESFGFEFDHFDPIEQTVKFIYPVSTTKDFTIFLYLIEDGKRITINWNNQFNLKRLSQVRHQLSNTDAANGFLLPPQQYHQLVQAMVLSERDRVSHLFTKVATSLTNE